MGIFADVRGARGTKFGAHGAVPVRADVVIVAQPNTDVTIEPPVRDHPREQSGRVYTLDHLRGIVALVVVVHHSLLTAPALAHQYHERTDLGPASWWITYTPLHLIWAGGEAVTIFFVLSGVVLTRPVLAGNWQGWRSYAASRFLRLYPPVAGAVAFTLLTIVLVPRFASSSNGWWLDSHAVPTTAANVAQAVGLVFKPSPLNSPLWSLKWEVIFSAALPFYVWAARRFPWAFLITIAVALSCAGMATRSLTLMYLPVFGLGAALGTADSSLAMSLLRTSRPGRWAGSLAACLMLTASWWPLNGLPVLGRGLALLGATLLVAVAWAMNPQDSTSQKRLSWLTWLGKRSFSIYLIHEPLVVSVSLATGWHGASVAAVAVPTSLLVGELFYRCVERPSHRLARIPASRVVRV